MILHGLAELANALNEAAEIHHRALVVTAEASSVVLEENIVHIFGDNSKLADLAQATQDERRALGYSENEPLLRTGELLRDSVEREHHGLEAGVGSEEPIMLYHELGYINARTGTSVPPRPVFHEGMEETKPEVAGMVEAALEVTFRLHG